KVCAGWIWFDCRIVSTGGCRKCVKVEVVAIAPIYFQVVRSLGCVAIEFEAMRDPALYWIYDASASGHPTFLYTYYRRAAYQSARVPGLLYFMLEQFGQNCTCVPGC